MYRIGFSKDIHKLVKGRKLMLAGIHIPFNKGELAHSDGDVIMHAISEAMLGAAALGDLGTFYPTTDKKYKNIASKEILMDTNKRIKKLKKRVIVLLVLSIILYTVSMVLLIIFANQYNSNTFIGITFAVSFVFAVLIGIIIFRLSYYQNYEKKVLLYDPSRKAEEAVLVKLDNRKYYHNYLPFVRATFLINKNSVDLDVYFTNASDLMVNTTYLITRAKGTLLSYEKKK